MGADLDVIERAIDIDASPETVFELLTDPAEYIKWKGRLADLDPRPGGRFHVTFKDSAVRGEYVEVVRKAFRFDHYGGPEALRRTYALQDAPRAHADLESRKTTGSIVMVV